MIRLLVFSLLLLAANASRGESPTVDQIRAHRELLSSDLLLIFDGPPHASNRPTVNIDNDQHSPNENLRLGNFVQGIAMLMTVLSRDPHQQSATGGVNGSRAASRSPRRGPGVPAA